MAKRTTRHGEWISNITRHYAQIDCFSLQAALNDRRRVNFIGVYRKGEGGKGGVSKVKETVGGGDSVRLNLNLIRDFPDD